MPENEATPELETPDPEPNAGVEATPAPTPEGDAPLDGDPPKEPALAPVDFSDIPEADRKAYEDYYKSVKGDHKLGAKRFLDTQRALSQRDQVLAKQKARIAELEAGKAAVDPNAPPAPKQWQPPTQGTLDQKIASIRTAAQNARTERMTRINEIDVALPEMALEERKQAVAERAQLQTELYQVNDAEQEAVNQTKGQETATEANRVDYLRGIIEKYPKMDNANLGPVVNYATSIVTQEILKEAQDAGLDTSGLTHKDIPIDRVASYVEQMVEMFGALRDEWRSKATEQSKKDKLRGASDNGGGPRKPPLPKGEDADDLAMLRGI